jgi:type II secretory pathway pseudopilin PulG
MIELMVVIGIIILAASLMGPTISDFFKNRNVDGARGQIGSVLNSARLRAVTEGRDFSVVFFREGPRIFDELRKQFRDDETWEPSRSFLNDPAGKLWYKLGFAGDAGRTSFDPGFARADYSPPAMTIPPYEWWLGHQAKRRSEGLGARAKVQVQGEVFDVTGLYKLIFHREGSMTFGPDANDVGTAEFQRNPYPRGDIEVQQLGNRTACFMDLRTTGQMRSRISFLSTETLRPALGGIDGSKAAAGDDSRASKRRSR